VSFFRYVPLSQCACVCVSLSLCVFLIVSVSGSCLSSDTRDLVL